MAKKSMIQRDVKRAALKERYSSKRALLKSIIMSKSAPFKERFAAQIKLSELPRDSAPTRGRNRCLLTGRPRGYYRKFRLCRIALRDMGSNGLISGLRKSSW